MRTTPLLFGCSMMLWASSARAGDLSDALRFAKDTMGEEAIEGYEDFIDDEPDEALALILADRVVPGRPVESYTTVPPFQALGPRLNYAQLAAPIEQAASVTGLPAALIDAVIRTESGYRPRAVSRAGAMGLMQLMPATARSLGVVDPFDPIQNILGGSKYLMKLFRRFKSLELAIAAYNAGPGRVARSGGIPNIKETRRYVKVVLQRYRNSPLQRRSSPR